MSCKAMPRASHCVLLAILLAGCSDAPRTTSAPPPQPAPPPASSRAVAALPSFGPLVERAGPAVVNVTATRAARSQRLQVPEQSDDPLFDFFRRFLPQPGPGEPPELRSQGIGSGFIIEEDGYILTNAHVVADADRVTVRLADAQRDLQARVIGVDRRTDIALLKGDGEKLPSVELGRSDALKAGDWVVAIGSPFGLANTITAGIVSATQRTLPVESFVPFIQTDVAVNPGNSGGPLLDAQGRVVGINSMIYSQTGGYMGVSFAIPIELALEVGRQLREHGQVQRGRMGVQIQPLTDELAAAFGMSGKDGVVITAVEPDGPAARAGLRAGDVVLTYDGEPIDRAEELPRLVGLSRPGSRARLEVWRGAERREIELTIGGFPAEPAPPRRSPAAPQPDRFGLAVQPLTAAQRRATGIESGVLVREAQGAAAAAGLQPGDIILTVNQTSVTSPAQLNRLLSEQRGRTVALHLLRNGVPFFVPLELPA